MKTPHRFGDLAQQHEERIRVAGVLGGQPLAALYLLGDQLGSEVTPVGEVAVQSCLADARAPRDLVHRHLGRLGEQLACGAQNRLPVALSVLAQGCFPNRAHGGSLVAEHGVRKATISARKLLQGA